MGVQTIYTAPCNESLSQLLTENLVIVGGVGIAFGLFEVMLWVELCSVVCVGVACVGVGVLIGDRGRDR